MPSTLGIVASHYTESTAFAPTDIAGCELWLDASDAATFTYSSGVQASAWNDKSGNARHYASTVLAQQPANSGTQNGLATLVFSAGQVMFPASAWSVARPSTAFVVVKFPASHPNFNHVLQYNMQVFDHGSGRYHAYGGSGYLVPSDPSGPYDDAAWHAHAILAGATTTEWVRDGTSLKSGSVGTAGWSSLNVSGTTTGAKDVAEVIIYNSALGTTDREAVEDYLRAKWGTP